MARDDPFWLRLLERMGVNVTRLRWRLYNLERKREQPRELPDSLRWLKFEHKICHHCGAVVPREDRVCPRCEGRVPSVAVYRVMRMLGLVFPKGSPVVTGAFLGASVVTYLLVILLTGPSAVMTQPSEALSALGMLTVWPSMGAEGLWRALAFGVLHANVMHIGFNAFAVMQLGPLLEEIIRRRRMLILITLAQLGAALATYIWYARINGVPANTIGASGWLFGLIGFGAAYARANPMLPRGIFLQWAAIAFIFGIMIGANNAAHAGGFIVGYALGLLPDGPRSRVPDRVYTVGAAICVGLWIGTSVMMVLGALAYQ